MIICVFELQRLLIKKEKQHLAPIRHVISWLPKHKVHQAITKWTFFCCWIFFLFGNVF